jgi:hypothetical protein
MPAAEPSSFDRHRKAWLYFQRDEQTVGGLSGDFAAAGRLDHGVAFAGASTFSPATPVTLGQTGGPMTLARFHNLSLCECASPAEHHQPWS